MLLLFYLSFSSKCDSEVIIIFILFYLDVHCYIYIGRLLLGYDVVHLTAYRGEVKWLCWDFNLIKDVELWLCVCALWCHLLLSGLLPSLTSGLFPNFFCCCLVCCLVSGLVLFVFVAQYSVWFVA